MRKLLILLVVGCGGVDATDLTTLDAGGGEVLARRSTTSADAEVTSDVFDAGAVELAIAVDGAGDSSRPYYKRNGASCERGDECSPGSYCVIDVCSACAPDKQDECQWRCKSGPVEGVPCSTPGGFATQCGYCIDFPDLWWTRGRTCPEGTGTATSCE